MTTWPQGVVTPWGASMLKDGGIPNIWITSADGNQKFYLMGGLAPFPGVTDGIICTKQPQGMAPPFKHLDIQAARQDGVTYQGTVYEPAKITLNLEVHARTPQALSRIMNEWMGAWRRPNTCTMEYITPDGGYWTAQVRLMPESWSDSFKLTPRANGVWSMTHVCRIDDSFWTTIDSTDNWGPRYEDFSDNFNTPTTNGLDANWLTLYSPGHTGYVYVNSLGEVGWSDSGNSYQWALNIYTADTTDSDYQVVTVQIGTGWDGVVLFGEATTIIGARMDTAGNGVFARVAWGYVEIYCVVNGVETLLYTRLLLIPPLPGETWQFIAGSVTGSPRTYQVLRGGATVVSFAEVGTTSPLGAANRYCGFGWTTAQGVFNEAHPAPIQFFAGADNNSGTQSGYLELSNQGTEDGWPEFLFYGPGTWAFGNGANSTDMVTVGPLAAGQKIFLATLPRYQRVIDITNGASTTGVYSSSSTSESLVSGLYTNPIPGVATPDLVALSQILVTITGGTASSQITASLTPRRIHPA